MSDIQVEIKPVEVQATVSGGFGPQGPAATITVGTVTTGAPGSSASVVNAGTSGAAVLNFTIPAGATGATGQAGATGATGPAGTTTWAGITDKPSTFTPASHTHGNITNAGAIGSTSGQIVVTGTGGALTTAETISSGQVQSLASGAYLDPMSGQTVTDALAELDSQIEAINYNLKPVAFSGSASDLTSGTVAIARIPTGTTSSTVCLGNDSRLSDARTPTSHAHGNLTNAGAIGSTSGQIVVTTTGGILTTASTLWGGVVEGLAGEFLAGLNEDGIWEALDIVGFQFPSYGNIANNGAIGATANLPIITTTGGVLAAGSFGTSANTFCQGNDSRLSDSRNPTSHTHAAGDIASGTLATARLGSGTANSTTFLRGDQTYAAPPVTSVDGGTGAVTITKATVYEFTRTSAPSGVTGSAGNWAGFSLPSTAKFVEFLVVAAGAGGGSGRRGAAGTARFGGGGGGGGGVIHTTVPASFITTTISVQIGSGGAGGAARTTDDTDGNSGSAGTYSSVSLNSYSNLLIGYSGLGGGGGTASAGSGGGSGGTANNRTWLGVAGSSSSATGVPNRAFPTGNVPQGGSAGGGISTGNVAYAGAGQYAYSTLLYQSAQLGSDVSGGAASTSAAATAGANGVSYGYGGCGGGASANGNNSGAGGNGGDGYVRITVWS